MYSGSHFGFGLKAPLQPPSSFHSLFTVIYSVLEIPPNACPQFMRQCVSSLLYAKFKNKLRRCFSNTLYCSSSRWRACESVAVLFVTEVQSSLLNLRNSCGSISSTARLITVDTKILSRSTIAVSPTEWIFFTLESEWIFRFRSEKITDIHPEVLSTM